jgi:hypothetical protein
MREKIKSRTTVAEKIATYINKTMSREAVEGSAVISRTQTSLPQLHHLAELHRAHGIGGVKAVTSVY